MAWNVTGFWDINNLAAESGWAHAVMAAYALWAGPVVLVLILAVAWWQHRRRAGAARSTATVLLTGLAAVVGLGVNQVASYAWHEQRPFLTLRHATVLLNHSADNSFPSDHATIGAALAVGILLFAPRWGALAIVMALLLGFSRIYTGMHYPLDVLAGFAIGATVAVLLVAGLSRPVGRLLDRRTPAALRRPVDTGDSAPPSHRLDRTA